MIEQVKASAGSGKTYALTGRFVSLLFDAHMEHSPAACGGPPDESYSWTEILAVTFTNKAAAEMKERVVNALKARALGQTGTPCDAYAPQAAAARLSRILRNYHQLNISTIDSLLSRIARIFALEAGLPPDFTPVFDSGDLFNEALDRLTEQAEAGDEASRALLGEALTTLLLLENRPGFQPGAVFRERLKALADHRLRDPSPYVTDAARLDAAVTPLREEFQARARALVPLLQGLDPLANFLKFFDKCLGHGPADEVPSSAYAAKESFAECVKKASQGAVGAPLELAYIHFKDAHAAYRDGRALLEAARNWAGFIRLADAVAALMRGRMAEAGVLLNALCPALARNMLQGEFGVPDAFCRLGARLRHMLVDEFQDTSRDQWAAMRPLAEECLSQGGGLYLVGDVKQAIYGWRGGDARLFDQVPEDPALRAVAEARRITLPMNWRSLGRVVAHNNDVFAPLESPETALAAARAMRENDPNEAVAELAGQVRTAFAGARQALPEGRDAGAGYVRLARVEAETGEELMDAVREELGALMAEITARRSPGDVAVLVRRNAEAALVADWLIGWGLPVVTKNSLRLAGHPVVRQLAALLRFLDYPLDDLALWEFASGGLLPPPECWPGRAELTDWLCGLDRGPLYPRFVRDFPRAAERCVSRYVKKAGFMTPYDVVSEAVKDFGVLARHPEAEPFVRRFLEVVHAAECDGRQSIAAFLEYWDADGAEEKVPLPENTPAVRVLTVHDAKGLEFPVVVAPFHHWEARMGGDLAPFEFQGMRLLMPMRREMGEQWHAHVNTQLVEQLALLYVAWTRPREELYCLLTHSPSFKGYRLTKALDALLAGRAFRPGARGLPTWESGAPPRGEAQAAPPAAAPAPAPARDQDRDEPMGWLPRLKIHRHFSESMSPDELLTGAPVFDARVRGTLVHDALDRLGQTGMDARGAARAAVSAQADVLPPGAGAREALEEVVAAILDWGLAQPDFEGWLTRGLPECPILDEDGNEHRPDLLVLDPEETVVVEYKTGAPDPAHEVQVRRYMRLLGSMRGVSRNMRAVIVYLDGRRMREVLP
ncbi:UvrD-helicase domain-containing protein [Desulfocurvus sp. DL9XJH121]